MNASPVHCSGCGAEWPAEAARCVQCGAARPTDAPADTAGQDYLQQIREQQRRVAEQLKPLETQRGWWRKYF